MNLNYKQSDSEVIVYDADLIDQPTPALFDPGSWQEQSAVRSIAKGRGNTLVLDTEFGPAVLRAYQRGGWARLLSSDQYLFTGFERSRALLEVRLLARLWKQGLPVPQPLAGLCVRQGLTYRAALLTREIPQARTLADCLGELSQTDPAWTQVGACIRKFHEAGVVHADLNARNILLADEGDKGLSVYLIDFDRSRAGKISEAAARANLSRLHRSLLKQWPNPDSGDPAACWKRFLAGYNTVDPAD